MAVNGQRGEKQQTCPMTTFGDIGPKVTSGVAPFTTRSIRHHRDSPLRFRRSSVCGGSGSRHPNQGEPMSNTKKPFPRTDVTEQHLARAEELKEELEHVQGGIA